METKLCSECLSEIPKEAKVCRFCSSRLIGVECKKCKQVNRTGAELCAYCGSDFSSVSKKSIEPFQIKSTLLGTILTQFNFIPQEANFDSDKVVVRTYGFLGLTSNDDEILWEKLAGFTHRSGLFWDAVGIETRGQSSAVIACLTRKNALKIIDTLRYLEK